MTAPKPEDTFYFHQLRDADLAFWYKGIFDDSITNNIIELGNFDISEKGLGLAKKRVSYLMAELFQNIVRHGLRTGKGELEGTFGVTNSLGGFHIFSSNSIEERKAELLRSKLEKVNSMTAEQLAEIYREILFAGVLSEKGGAGLGLIDMVRKSEQPIQYEFRKVKGRTEFAMQVDMNVAMGDGPVHQNIKDTIDFSEHLSRKGTFILFKGNFEEDSTAHVLNVLLRNTDLVKGATGKDKLIFHASVELLQNISRHALVQNGMKEGVFELARMGNRFRVTTQNILVKRDKDRLDGFLEMINRKSREELDIWYKRKLKESVRFNTDSAGVGLIDLGRCSDAPISYSFEELDSNYLFTISVLFVKPERVNDENS